MDLALPSMRVDITPKPARGQRSRQQNREEQGSQPQTTSQQGCKVYLVDSKVVVYSRMVWCKVDMKKY